jgi:hypothetical protein
MIKVSKNLDKSKATALHSPLFYFLKASYAKLNIAFWRDLKAKHFFGNP